MGEYLFRFPGNMPRLTYEALNDATHIGTTITVQSIGRSHAVELYHTTIAYIGSDSVIFPHTNDHHQATRIWIERIVQDNGIGRSVFRNRKGVLVIDGDDRQPVEGHEYATK